MCSELAADGPQIGKKRLEQSAPEKVDARAPAGSDLVADGALNHFDVAVAPLLETLVEVGQEFEQVVVDSVLGLKE